MFPKAPHVSSFSSVSIMFPKRFLNESFSQPAETIDRGEILVLATGYYTGTYVLLELERVG